MGCYDYLTKNWNLTILISHLLASRNSSVKIQMSANRPKNRKSEAPCAHLDWEREKSVYYFKTSWDAVNTQSTQNKDPFFPPYIIYVPSKNYMPVLFPARREKHAYSWSDKYLSGIYLNERAHLQTFPGSEILPWADRGRIISSGRFKTPTDHLPP